MMLVCDAALWINRHSLTTNTTANKKTEVWIEQLIADDLEPLARQTTGVNALLSLELEAKNFMHVLLLCSLEIRQRVVQKIISGNSDLNVSHLPVNLQLVAALAEPPEFLLEGKSARPVQQPGGHSVQARATNINGSLVSRNKRQGAAV